MSEGKKRIGLKFKLISFVLLALVIGGFGLGAGLRFGGFGLSPGGDGSGTGAAAQNSPGRIDASQTPPAGTGDPQATAKASRMEIIVSEKEILYNGEPCSIQSLREALLADYDGKAACELVDRHAIKSAYDACKAILDELNITYEEK